MMDTVKSFKGYGKVDELEERAFRRKSRKRILIVVISAVVLVTVIIGAVAGTIVTNRNNSGDAKSPPETTAESLKAVCKATDHPDSCFTSISALETNTTTVTDPEQIFKLSLQVVLNELDKVASLPETMMAKIKDEQVKSALLVCQTAFQDAIDNLNDSISLMKVNNGAKLLSQSRINNLRTWLSTAVTNQETCLDAIYEVNTTISNNLYEEMGVLIANSTEFTSNSLAIVTKILAILSEFDIPIHRKLLGLVGSEFPDWVTAGDRRLLQADKPTVPDLTVAKDGSGDYKTIKEAMAKVPKKSLKRFVIYVKAGVYLENVNLDKSSWNVMMYGDGMNNTIVSGSLNKVDGVPTFSTATFAAVGKGFIAKDMGFKNTAGPEKHQAVAFRSGSDFSVFFRCSFDAYQDTLYAHSNRQFYRDCNITGTVDFIFGNAAVVFQNCSIMPRQPLENQFNTITAQGKKDPNQNTGIIIQKCTMTPLNNLTVQTYLGRPWKDYSTTVIMQTNIGSFLNPLGWTEWVPDVEPPRTIFYAEYQNTGLGSSVAQRVKWAGYKPILTTDQASKFTVQSFIQGSDWLPATNVAFQSSL